MLNLYIFFPVFYISYVWKCLRTKHGLLKEAIVDMTLKSASFTLFKNHITQNYSFFSACLLSKR